MIDFQQAVADFAHAHHVPGLGAIYVERDGARIVACVGEIGPHTPVPIGSLTKSFTGFWFERTAGRHHLTLASEVSPGVTLGALFAHSSGLQGSVHAGMATATCPDPGLPEATLLELLKTRDASTFRYSNLGYELIRRRTERALNEDFKPSLAAVLPGLEHTHWIGCNEPLIPGYVGGKRIPPIYLRDAAAGGLVSDLEDLAEYARALMKDQDVQGNVLMPWDRHDELFTNHIPAGTASFGLKYGMGWNLNGLGSQDGQPIYWHRGGYFPYQAQMAILPRQGRALVILANANEAQDGIFDLTRTLLEASNGHKVEPERYEPPAPYEPAAYAGAYAGINGELTALKAEGNALAGQLYGQPLALEPANGVLIPTLKALFLSFAIPGIHVAPREQAGQRYLVVEGYGEPLIMRQLGPSPVPPAWRRAFGRYVLGARNLTTRVLRMTACELLERDRRLVARLTLQNPGVGPEVQADVPLKAIDDLTAVIVEDNTRLRLLPDGLELSGFVMQRAARRVP